MRSAGWIGLILAFLSVRWLEIPKVPQMVIPLDLVLVPQMVSHSEFHSVPQWVVQSAAALVAESDCA